MLKRPWIVQADPDKAADQSCNDLFDSGALSTSGEGGMTVPTTSQSCPDCDPTGRAELM
jgi:hypothetical protein